MCSENYIKSLNEEIDKAAGLDSRYFWNLVNKRRTKSSGNIGAEVRFNGRVYRDSQQIYDQWKQYFHQLYSSTESDNFDNVHYDNVTARVDELKRQSFNENDVDPTTERELKDAISQLSKGKASGDDCVDNEHIIYSGNIFRHVLLTLYNSMYLRSYIPNDMKSGIIITLFKGGNKRKDQGLRFGFVAELLQLLEDYNLGYILHEYIDTGVFPSKYTWKKLVRDNINIASTVSTRHDIADNGLERFLSIHAEMEPSYFWELSRKHPHMLNACRSVVKLIALTFNRYQPEAVCLACGVQIGKYVDHCLLWCNANAHVRHKMWVGLWHKYGTVLYLRLAGLSHGVLIEVFFGRFDVIADILADTLKDAFYCYLARFMHIHTQICVKPVG